MRLLALRSSSSNVTSSGLLCVFARVRSPPGWFFSQVSPVDTPQSCMSLHRFGTTNDSLGSVVRSVGKSLNRLLAEDGTLLKSTHGLCFRAYRPEVQPV